MPDTDKPFHLVVFFSYGVSLSLWAETGLLDRELLLYKKMVAGGNRVTLVTYGGVEDRLYMDQLHGIEVVPVYERIGKSKNRWLNLVKSFLVPFKFKKLFPSATVFKTNQMVGAWVPILATVLYRKKFVVRCGYEMLRNYLRDEKRLPVRMISVFMGYVLEFLAYSLADDIIISNRSDIEFIRKIFPVRDGKIHLIRNFIQTDHFAPSIRVPRLNDEKRMLYVGRLDPRKNLVSLIRAVAAANCRLDIVGKGTQRPFLEKVVSDYKANVNFLGCVGNHELPGIINKYDICVLPSFYENNPKTLLEEMSCGKVVIGTDVHGIRELIDHGVTGYLTKTDAQSIKSVIEKALAADPGESSAMGRQARKIVVDECSVEMVYMQETRLYQ